MPAKSVAQQHLFGMLEHNPGMSASKGIHMTHSQMHDFAATPTKGLPDRVSAFQAMQPRKKKFNVGHSVIGEPGHFGAGGVEVSGV